MRYILKMSIVDGHKWGVAIQWDDTKNIFNIYTLWGGHCDCVFHISRHNKILGGSDDFEIQYITLRQIIIWKNIWKQKFYVLKFVKKKFHQTIVYGNSTVKIKMKPHKSTPSCTRTQNKHKKLSMHKKIIHIDTNRSQKR